jgi:hypothetical protein
MRKQTRSDYLIKHSIKTKPTEVTGIQTFSSEFSERLLFVDESVIQGLKDKVSTYSDLRFFEPKLSSRATISEFGFTSNYSKNFNEYVALNDLVYQESQHY